MTSFEGRNKKDRL